MNAVFAVLLVLMAILCFAKCEHSDDVIDIELDNRLRNDTEYYEQLYDSAGSSTSRPSTTTGRTSTSAGTTTASSVFATSSTTTSRPSSTADGNITNVANLAPTMPNFGALSG